MSGLDAGALLRRALEQSATALGLAIRITHSDSTRWASATFTGARHALMLELGALPAAERWLANLGDAELPLRGQLVADLKVVRVGRANGLLVATIEVLTVEDR